MRLSRLMLLSEARLDIDRALAVLNDPHLDQTAMAALVAFHLGGLFAIVRVMEDREVSQRQGGDDG